VASERGWLFTVTFPIFVEHNTEGGATNEKEARNLANALIASGRWPRGNTPKTMTVQYVKG